MVFRRYGLAVFSVAVAIGLVLLLRSFDFRDIGGPGLVFAVVIASWYGGTGPAVLATILAILGDNYFCVRPYYSFAAAPSDLPYFIIFSALTVCSAWFATLARRREDSLRRTEAYLIEAQHLSHSGIMPHSRVTSLSAGRIVLGYAVIGILWIALSDEVVTFLKLPPAVMTMKGTLFVLVTASLLYVAIRRLIQALQLTTLELRQNEGFLAEAQRLSHTGSWAWNVPAGRPDYWSEEMFRIFGFDPREPIPPIEVFMQRIHPDDSRRVQTKFDEVFHQTIDQVDDFKFMMPDGSVKHIHSTAHPVLNEASEAVKVIGSMMDVTELRRAEESLRESETRFRTIVNHAGDALFIYDFELQTLVDVSQRACESLGYTREELIGKEPHLFHDDWYHVGADSVVKRAAAGETVFDTHWHRRKDGSKFPVEVHTSFVSYGDRRYLLKVARDISDRLKSEQALRQSEAYLAEAQRLSHTGSWARQSISGKSDYWSDEMFRIYGFDPKNGTPTREAVLERIHPDDRKRWRESFINVRDSKSDAMDEYRIVLPDGTLKHIHATRHAVVNEAGEVIRMVGTAIDVTERKNAEESLALWGFALDNARDAAFFIDEQARFLYVNERACQSLGYSRQELLRMGVPDIDPDFPKERWPQQWRNVKAQQYVNMESRHRTKDGRFFPVEITASYMEYEGKAFNFAVARDITERKKTEQRIKAFQDELQQLTRYLNKAREEERTAIARDLHDELGQQLSILTIDLAGLENRLPSDDKALAAMLKDINDRLDEAIRTVQRLATGLRPALLDDLGLLAAIQWQAKEFSKRTGIPSDVTVPKEAIKLDRDLSTALFRIFQESLTNVARHSRASRVRVRFDHDKNGVSLEIKDNGRGIRQTEAGASSSLGLIGMRERVRPWNGNLEVAGRDGEGTTVRVTVPPAS